MTAPLCAVVLAARGGAALGAALDAVAWATQRAVLDPAGAVRPPELPAGVPLGRRLDELGRLGTAPWLLLLAEGEAPAPSFAEAVAGAAAAGPAALRPRLELDALHVRFAVPAAPVRVAPRPGTRIILDRGGMPGLAAPYPARRLDATIRLRGGDSVADAFEALQADGRVLSAMLAQLGDGVRRGGRLAMPAAALGRVLRARADRPAGLARWVAAVFAGYRVVLAQAQWWEWRHAQPAVVREVG
jgi:hypothetical protein